MSIRNFSLTTILTLIYPFTTAYTLSAATSNTSNIPSLSQTTVIHQPSVKFLTKLQQENTFDVLSKGLEIAQSFDDNQLKVQALVDIASRYIAIGEKEKASKVLFQALKVSQSLQLNQADFYTIGSNPSKFDLLFDIAVKYAALEQKEKASEILSQALQEALSIKVYTAKIYGLSDIAIEYVALGEEEKSNEVFSQTIQVIKLFNDNEIQLKNLEIVVSKALQVGQVDQALNAAQVALNIAQTIKKDAQKIEALTEIANYYILAKQKEKAFEILSQALQVAQSKELDDFSRGKALTQISAEYIKIGQKEKAFEILHKAFQIPGRLYFSGENLHVITKAYAAEQYDQVLLFSATINPEAAATVLSEVSTKLVSMGQYERAIKIAENLKSDVSKTNALLMVVRVAAVRGHYEKALKVVQTLKSDSDKTDALLEVVKGAAKAGHYEQAFKVTQGLKSDSDKTKALLEIVRGAVDTEPYEQVLKIAQPLKSDSAKTYLLTVITSHYLQTGQYDQALKLAETLDSDAKVEIVANIADYYAAGGQYEQALKLAQTMDNANKANLLALIANYSAVAGQKKRASELLTQALQITQSLPVDNQFSLSNIAVGLAATGQYDRALKLASIIESSSKDSIEMLFVLTGIAGHYGAAGQREKAIETLTKALKFNKIAIEQSGFRCSVDFLKPMLYEIVNRYLAKGQYDQSLQISQITEDESFKLKLLNKITLNYVEDKKKESRKIRLASIPGGACGDEWEAQNQLTPSFSDNLANGVSDRVPSL